MGMKSSSFPIAVVVLRGVAPNGEAIRRVSSKATTSCHAASLLQAPRHTCGDMYDWVSFSG